MISRRGLLSGLLALPALRWLRPAPPPVPQIIPDWTPIPEGQILADVLAMRDALKDEKIYGPYVVTTPAGSVMVSTAVQRIGVGDLVRSDKRGRLLRCGRRTRQYAVGVALDSCGPEGGSVRVALL